MRPPKTKIKNHSDVSTNKLATIFFAAFLVGYVKIAGPFKFVDLGLIIFGTFLLQLKSFKSQEFWLIFVSFVLIFLSSAFVAISVPYLEKEFYLMSGEMFAGILALLVGISLGMNGVVLFLTAFACSMGIVNLLALSGHIGLFDVPFREYSSSRGSFPLGTFSDPSRYGFAAVFGCLFCLLKVESKNFKRFLKIGFVVSFLAVLEGGQRASFVMLILSLICILMLLIIKRRVVPKYLYLTFLISFPILSIFLLVTSGESRLGSKTGSQSIPPAIGKIQTDGLNYFEDSRYLKLIDGLSSSANRVFLGSGADRLRGFYGFQGSHNSYLEILVSGGGFSFSLYMLAISILSLQAIRAIVTKLAMLSYNEVIILFSMLVFVVWIFLLNIQFSVLPYALLGFFIGYLVHVKNKISYFRFEPSRGDRIVREEKRLQPL